jgi:hypothetical protein
MRFMMIVHQDEAALAKVTPAGMKALYGEFAAFNEALLKVGRPGERLQPSTAATSVRLADGKTEVQAGPPTQSERQLAGFFWLDVPDLDEAIAWATRYPAARFSTIEVRPMWEQPGATA